MLETLSGIFCWLDISNIYDFLKLFLFFIFWFRVLKSNAGCSVVGRVCYVIEVCTTLVEDLSFCHFGPSVNKFYSQKISRDHWVNRTITSLEGCAVLPKNWKWSWSVGKELGAGVSCLSWLRPQGPWQGLWGGILARLVVPYGSPCGPLAFQGSSGLLSCMNRL